MSVEVVSEPLTYERHAPQSYFRDLALASRDPQSQSARRIERHEREMRVEAERFERAARDARPEGLEYRLNPDRAPGQGGSFAPPLWLIEQFATAPRPRRALAKLIPNFPLPQGVQSVNLPRLTTGNQTAPAGDLATVADADAVDAQVSSPVVTVAGQGDVSLQSLEQSPAGAHLDWAYFKDLGESYDAQLEAQLINGSGTGGQLPGLLSITVPASNQVTPAASSATGMFTSFGSVIAAVGNNRKVPPEHWLMTTSRMAWLGSSEDTQQRPLMITDKDGAGKFDLLGFPVEMTDAIPTNLGTTGNQDRVIACIPSDMLLLESAPRAAVMLDVLSGVLQARLQLHRYVAALVGRYPTGIAYLTGANMAVAAGF